MDTILIFVCLSPFIGIALGIGIGHALKATGLLKPPVIKGDPGLNSSLPSNNNEPYIPVFNDRAFEEKWELEQKKEVIRRERSFLSDEEIRDRHGYAWGQSDTDRAFKEIDEPQSFIGWLFK